MKKKEEEVKKKEIQLKKKESELNERERALAEKEKELEELERAMEQQRLKKYSGSSTNAFTDQANGSEHDKNYFTSPHNELIDSIGFQNPSFDVSRDESFQPQNGTSRKAPHPKLGSIKNSQEIHSGEFKSGNLSGLLRDNSG